MHLTTKRKRRVIRNAVVVMMKTTGYKNMNLVSEVLVKVRPKLLLLQLVVRSFKQLIKNSTMLNSNNVSSNSLLSKKTICCSL